MRTIGNIERFLVIGIVVVIGAILAVAIKGADDLEGAYKKQVQVKAGEGKKGGGTPLSKTDQVRGSTGATNTANAKEGKGDGVEKGALGTDPAHLSAEIQEILNRKKRAESGQPQTAPAADGSGQKSDLNQKPEVDPKTALTPTPSGNDVNGGARSDGDAGAPVVIKDDPQPNREPAKGAAGGAKSVTELPKVDPSATTIEWTYEVQPGDRLERIASTLYGDRSMWKEILTANPAYTDPTRIRAGTVLTLPKPPTNTTAVGLAHGATKVAAATAADPHHDPKAAADDKAQPNAIAAPAPAKSATYKRVTSTEQYEVQKGDTLMAIAATHYGTRAAWRMILGANAERISDKDHIKPGTVLKLPAQ